MGDGEQVQGVVASTDELLAAATALAAARDEPALQRFSGLYLDWILRQRGMSRQTADRRERTSLVLHAALAAKSLGEALQIYARFSPLLWGDRWLTSLRDAGDKLELVYTPSLREGAAGLVNDLWDLSRALCELEWLVGGPLEAEGRVRAQRLIDPAAAALLFGRPVTFGAAELVLAIPRKRLGRGVVARARDIERFCISLPLITLAGGAPKRPELKTLVAGLIRRDRLQAAPGPATLASISAQLGQSPATLRRQLRAEGASFREISDGVLDDLACSWLADTALTIETIADRLGYSDAFAFRRGFRRRNGCSPSVFRRDGGVSRPSAEIAA